MDCVTESTSEKDTRHEWLDDERYVLLMLKDNYDLDWSSVVPIWNLFFQGRLEGHGVQQAALMAQHSQTRRKLLKAGQKAGYVVVVPPEISEEGVKKQIEIVARGLGITVACGGSRNIPATPTGRSKRKFITPPETPDHHQNSSINVQLLTPLSPSPNLRLDLEGSPLASRKRVRVEIVNQDDIKNVGMPADGPAVAFRGWSMKSQGLNGGRSGFQAGLFVEASKAQIPPCPDPRSEQFDTEATYHVGWTKGRPSPFISVTISPVRALMRARAPKQGRWIAIIDLARLRAECAVFMASDLKLHPLRADGTIIPYQPGGEWLIWGRIPAECVLSVCDVDDLISPPPSIPSDKDPLCLEFISTAWRRVATRSFIHKQGRLMLSFFAGSAVGQLCLLLFPDASEPQLEALVERIVTDWSFKTRKHEDWRQNFIFCEGLARGFSREESVLDADKGEVIDLTGEEDLLSIIDELAIADTNTYEPETDDFVIVKKETSPALRDNLDNKGKFTNGLLDNTHKITDYFHVQSARQQQAQRPHEPGTLMEGVIESVRERLNEDVKMGVMPDLTWTGM